MFIREVPLVIVPMPQYLPLVTHAAIDAIITQILIHSLRMTASRQLLTVSGGSSIQSLQLHSLTTGIMMYVCIKSLRPAHYGLIELLPAATTFDRGTLLRI
jgi:hypothetical protein